MNKFTENFLNKYVAKKYWEAVEEVEHDSLDGYFIYLKDGYNFSTTDCHTDRADTVAEARKVFKFIVEAI